MKLPVRDTYQMSAFYSGHCQLRCSGRMAIGELGGLRAAQPAYGGGGGGGDADTKSDMVWTDKGTSIKWGTVERTLLTPLARGKGQVQYLLYIPPPHTYIPTCHRS